MKVTITVEIDGNELQRDYVILDVNDTQNMGNYMQDMIESLDRYNKEPIRF